VKEPNIRLAEVDGFVHLNAMKMSQFRQRLGRLHPISTVAYNHLRPKNINNNNTLIRTDADNICNK